MDMKTDLEFLDALLLENTLIKQIQPAGPQTYKARVFVADRNIHAAGKIRQLSANRLQVSGCALAVLCKTTQWVRVR